MSGHEEKRLSTTTTVTTTETQQETVAPGFDVLTTEEEKVLRMLHGLSEDDKHRLKFALGADEELQLRLAMMEKYLVELFQGEKLDEDLMEDIRNLKQSMLQES